MEGEAKARREESEQCACRFPKSCVSASARRAAAAPGQLESARVGTQPGSQSGLGRRRSLPAARSPPLSLPASQPAGARAPAPPPPAVGPPPPPASRKRVAPRRATRWGRPCWGRGPRSRQQSTELLPRTLVTRSWPSLLSGFSGWGSSKTRGPTKQPASASLPGAPERNPVWLPLSMQLPSQLKPLVQDSHNPDILASHKTEQKPTNLTAPGL